MLRVFHFYFIKRFRNLAIAWTNFNFFCKIQKQNKKKLNTNIREEVKSQKIKFLSTSFHFYDSTIL